MHTAAMPSWHTPSKIDLPMNYYRHISISTLSLSPQMHKMDNETFADIEHLLATQNTALQYVPLVITAPMLWSEQSKLGKIISFLVLPVSPKIFQLHTGIDSLTKPTSLSIECNPINQIQLNLLMKHSMALFTFSQYLSHCQE